VNYYYCDLIVAADPRYAPRPAEFDLGSEAPRCAWHWRFVCDHCGEPGHFASRFFCPRSGRLLCRNAGRVESETGDFWNWHYWYVLECPDCGERHPGLDRAEFTGPHPWQLDREASAARRWLASEPHVIRYPSKRLPRVDLDRVTDADISATWSANADLWDAGYDERGDENRRYLSDPVLLALLGDVRGQRVLDAGSGAGYLARAMAKRGARVVAVENAARFHELAIAYQQREPIDVEFHHASISAMPFLPAASVDAAVANYVLMDVRHYEAAVAEITRVLKPSGRFVCALTHWSLDGRWHVPAADSPRIEDRAYWMDDDYFIRRAGYIQWGQFKPFLSFHRPLRDYIAACRTAGLELRDLDEPELTEEGLQTLHPVRAQYYRRVSFAYILKFVKT
jgi:SAM-dependent methyltransferase